MAAHHLARHTERVLAVLLLVTVVGIAYEIRAVEPLASPVIVAEDPLTHIDLMKEDVARGFFAPSTELNMGLYPPGLHAWFGSVWMLSGIDAYQTAVWLPVIFSLLGAAVLFLFAYRFSGLAAAFVASLLFAIFPEVVFRSVLFSPTALDLAYVPLLAWLIAEVIEGASGRAYLVPTAIVGASLGLAHPWMLAIVVGAGTIVVVLQHQFASTKGVGDASARRARFELSALFIALAVLGWLTAGTADSDKGIARGFLALVAGGALFAALTATEAFTSFRFPRLGAIVREDRVVLSWIVGIALAVVAYVAMLVIWPPVLPTNVDYSLMLGPVAAIAAFAGIVAVVPARNSFGWWGLALTVVLFPFTAEDLLNLWYIPHRTVVFLAIGIAILGGVAAQAVVEAVRSAVRAWHPKAAPWGAMAAACVLAIAATPAVIAETPNHPYTWYRLYNAKEFQGLEFAANMSGANAANKVLTGSWQAAAFVRALGAHDHVVDDPLFFSGQTRGEWYGWVIPGHLYVVDDQYIRNSTGDPFASDPSYDPVWQCSCGTMTVYVWRG
ncbi:MAG: hypothetical protein ACYDDF_11815 [Thermoplasmatota archaeon]